MILQPSLVLRFGLIIYVFLAFVGCTGINSTTTTDAKDSDPNAENSDEYYQDTHIRYRDYVYDPQIRTILFHKTGFVLGAPMIRLGSTEAVSLTFDDLAPQSEEFYYKVIHCTSNWEPSDLLDSEYLDGFFVNTIRDYRPSINTYVPYTQHKLTVPNEDLKITKSGNYILLVYRNNDEEQMILTRRFMVFEEKVQIKANIRFPSNLNERARKQELDFTIQHAGFPIPQPQSDLHVVMLQNNRWDNAISGLQPIFMKDNELTYDYNTDENLFPGGNEFRFFDLKSVRYRTEDILKIDRIDSVFHVWLADDVPRTNGPYYNNPDINGRYIVRNADAINENLEADYMLVHFKVPFAAPLKDGDMYIFGGLTDWRFDKRFRMKYNYSTMKYEADVQLKQGYYNYHYVTVKDNSGAGDLTLTEGNHFETENDYTILAYFRGITDDYDRLVGVGFFNSRRNP